MAWLWSCSSVASSLPSDDLLGRARTVSAAPLLHHARSKERISQQIRTIWAAAPTQRRLPPFGQRDQAFALRQFPGSFARASNGFCLLAGFALGRLFVRFAT